MKGKEEAMMRLAAAIGRGLVDVAEGRVVVGRAVLARLERKYASTGEQQVQEAAYTSPPGNGC